MDSSRVLLALQEKLKWEGRKERIEEKLKQLRARKRQALRQLREVRSRITHLTALSSPDEADRLGKNLYVRLEGLR